MDLALKKIELINWLTKQDQDMIEKIEMLRKSSLQQAYETIMGEDLEMKLSRSEADIVAGRTYSQEQVEAYFKNKAGH